MKSLRAEKGKSKTTMESIKKYPIGIIAGIFVMICFLSCQAGQQRSQKPPTAKDVAAASAQNEAKKSDDPKTPAIVENKIVVYYFRTTMRCPTCLKLESYAKSEIETAFADAIKKGKLEWKTVNVEDKGNEHFVDDYKLYTKSVIVSNLKDGRESSWKNLDRIWQLVHEEARYREYIRSEVTACLEGKCL
jgi:hypothetical protein